MDAAPAPRRFPPTARAGFFTAAGRGEALPVAAPTQAGMKADKKRQTLFAVFFLNREGRRAYRGSPSFCLLLPISFLIREGGEPTSGFPTFLSLIFYLYPPMLLISLFCVPKAWQEGFSRTAFCIKVIISSSGAFFRRRGKKSWYSP